MTLVAVAAGLLSAARAPASDPFLDILTLEAKRSLGAGALARYLNSSDERIVTRAALAIGRTRKPAGDALLAPHLKDTRIPVRAMATYGIGLIASGAQADAVVAAAADPSGAVRVAALDAIARYEAAHRFDASHAPAAQKAVERLLAGDSDPIVRARAATALVEFREGTGATEAAQALSAAFRNDADAAVRWHAMWSIYRGYALLVDRQMLELALKSPEELVRIEAVRAFGRYKDPKLVDTIAPLLDDASWRVQEQAAETILLLQGQKQTEHWKAIPASVHVPAVEPDPYASLRAMARPKSSGKPGRPRPAQAMLSLQPNPATSRAMTEPVAGPHPRVRIVTTKGNLYVVLYPEWAPLTVANFLNLAVRGYYDGNRWFRIVPDFVVQTGDPNDNGEGDAGYTIGAEENPLEQRSYVISMGLNYDDKTNTPIRDSAGTQYYVTLSPQLHLDRDFSVFGEVVSGLDVLGRLVESDRVLRVERIADETVK